ncbi:MAG: methyltransferase [Phenylobacterium sp.]|uniref:methyltransferase n=1 Tax=Phenylobacterium sp. TaxID=1871053 RepID=UPI002733C390|nr:methyltransferase [Phenylobacterium sp.]MDP1642117.1 methyltransferase [Phenylobacterium sp.]MDP3117371.1 methyltransferase [Phenylobacterium sp.]MDP3385549.1 methyltransferase [Phenylobacterium sp.]
MTLQPLSLGQLDHRAEPALRNLLKALKQMGHHFVPPSPTTHARVLARDPSRQARSLRDVFGWSLPFARDLPPASLLDALLQADLVVEDKGLLRSRVRVATLEGELFLHSAYPTTREDAVFFGPDTYRFAAFLKAELADVPPGGVLVDIGAGSGAGAVVAARLTRPRRTILTDINTAALRLARVNVQHAGCAAELVLGEGLSAVEGPLDLVIANPPFIAGEDGHTYRDGGDLHGARVALDWTQAALKRLAPGGRLVLYTGSAIVEGEDLFFQAVKALAAGGPFDLRRQELDPDIFGDQLSDPAYADVDRIAAVGVSVRRWTA